MTYSTSVVTNTRDLGTAAAAIFVNVRNNDIADTTVLITVIASVDSENFYTAYLSGFVVPPGGYEVMTFNIAGNVAYEVQVFVNKFDAFMAPALVSVYGVDEFGNLVENQGFSPQDLTVIG
ncbi:hypothetical protein SAMN05428962_4299 [Paenibacillus sp. BC26]|nr:hypothetical protein SAMN05428962_4299 [Paenibacillus sp. BC26]